MLKSWLTRLIETCTRVPWLVVAAFSGLGIAAAAYSLSAFSISTDTKRLLPASLPWRQAQSAYDRLFPAEPILAVIDAPTPEAVSAASAALVSHLAGRSIERVTRLDGGEFFERSSLLFGPLARTRALADMLAASAPVVGIVARDPNLRGVAELLVAEAKAIQAAARPGQEAQAGRLLRDATGALEAARESRPDWFSWQAAMGVAGARRALVGVAPRLDYKALQPGRAATDLIRATASSLALGPRFGATVRLTGEVPIDDEQFATLRPGQVVSTLGTALAVLVVLWLALRSVRIIGAVAVTLAVGFAVTCALGLLMVGSFNLLSIAFAVLFVGLGADFGIQFSVRYRAERHDVAPDPGSRGGGKRAGLRAALVRSAAKAGLPLSLACAGTTVGFFSFIPTDYTGVSELGLIAGVGMLVAFATTMTLLPALLTILAPPPEPERIGFSGLAGLDRFLGSHRVAVVAGTLLVVGGGTLLLPRLRFDFDPTHLQLPSAPAVRTYRDLASAPSSGIAAIEIAADSLAAAVRLTRRLDGLPEVSATRTALSLVPEGQDAKLAMIGRARQALAGALSTPALPAPSDAQLVRALREAAAQLSHMRGREAMRAATALSALAGSPPAARARAADALVVPLRTDLMLLRAALGAQLVTVETLPASVARQWIAPDGRARVEVLPSGEARDDAVLLRFARAVRAVAPRAAGSPVTLAASRRTVLEAFAHAGLYAVAAIALVLLAALRRPVDVLLTLLPLLVAGLLTLELCVLIGQPLNYANVVALPLLLGVGVAFKIYYVMAWRRGATSLLQSTLTRAVLFSAMTTGAAFASLWLSPQPGLSSMGELMALALICTLVAAVLFQPALMGPPRVPPERGPR